MKHLIVTVLFLALWLPGFSQDRNLQVRVIEVISNKKNLVKCKCVAMSGEIVFVEYSWRGWRSKNRLVGIGTWFSVLGNWEHKEGERYFSKIKINK